MPSGDMPPDEFRRHGHALVEWIARYFEQIESRPILPDIAPGDIARALPASAPAQGEAFDALIADLDRVVAPNATHWNHPGFFAYFAITGSAPGVLMEFVSAALNQQAMLWRTSPIATELEEVVMRWFARLVGIPDEFEGVIYDTASISTLHGLAAAREAAIPDIRTRGLAGRTDLGACRFYASEHAHSSVDKAIITLGFGHDALHHVPADADLRMRADTLADAIAADRARGVTPIAVVATIGTTSATSADDVAAIAEVCARERVWLHLDAAYAGVMGMVPGYEWIGRAFARADSIVINPHKWLFTPFDLSAFYCRRMDMVRQAFSLIPEYLKTTDAASARNLMDTGVQLGRRFRALKFWAVMRYFGADGLRARLAEHVRLAKVFASWVDADARFERVAPVPFSVVCFRARPAALAGDENALEALNADIMARVNQSGEVFLSHTKLNGRYVIRLAIGNVRTEERHIRRAWDLLAAALDATSA